MTGRRVTWREALSASSSLLRPMCPYIFVGLISISTTLNTKSCVNLSPLLGIIFFKFTLRIIQISNASETTNCAAVILKVLHEKFGIQEAMLTTVHASTAEQKFVDGLSKHGSEDLRAGRSIVNNIIPSNTSVSHITEQLLPDLKEKIGWVYMVGWSLLLNWPCSAVLHSGCPTTSFPSLISTCVSTRKLPTVKFSRPSRKRLKRMSCVTSSTSRIRRLSPLTWYAQRTLQPSTAMLEISLAKTSANWSRGMTMSGVIQGGFANCFGMLRSRMKNEVNDSLSNISFKWLLRRSCVRIALNEEFNRVVWVFKVLQQGYILPSRTYRSVTRKIICFI